MKQDPNYEVNCPTITNDRDHCKGTLQWVSTQYTDMFYAYYDQNMVTETWECDVCKNRFTRCYKWNVVEPIDLSKKLKNKSAPVRIFHKNADPSEWLPSEKEIDNFFNKLNTSEKDND